MRPPNFRVHLTTTLALLLGSASTAFAAQDSTIAAPRTSPGWWMERHESLSQAAQNNQWDLVFIGDSITDAWDNNGKEVWQQYYADRQAGNLGIGGDETQHVLYRLENGNLAGQSPKLAVVMIGTNNLGNSHMEPPAVIKGIEAVVETLHRITPDTQILLLGVFPRGQQADNPFREQIKEVNAAISKLDEEPYVHYKDIGQVFLEDDGSLSKEIMPDFLHLSPEGYTRWAKAIESEVAELMGERTPAAAVAP